MSRPRLPIRPDVASMFSGRCCVECLLGLDAGLSRCLCLCLTYASKPLRESGRLRLCYMLGCFWRRSGCAASSATHLSRCFGRLRVPADSVSSPGAEFEPIPKHHVLRVRKIICTKLETDWEAAVFVDCPCSSSWCNNM